MHATVDGEHRNGVFSAVLKKFFHVGVTEVAGVMPGNDQSVDIGQEIGDALAFDLFRESDGLRLRIFQGCAYAGIPKVAAMASVAVIAVGAEKSDAGHGLEGGRGVAHEMLLPCD
jgi:hypothetical protein